MGDEVREAHETEQEHETQALDLSKLTDGAVVEYRTGRAGRTSVRWNEWQRGAMFVTRRTKRVPGYRGPDAEVGRIICLTPKNTSWAEYTQSDYDPKTNTWTAEDYYMQIREAKAS